MYLARDGAPSAVTIASRLDAVDSVDISCGCPVCRTGDSGSTQAAVSGSSPVDSIDWGSQLASNNVTVYFALAGETYDGVTSEGWTEYEVAQAMAALATYADVSNLRFSITTDQSTATFTLVTTTSNDYLGYFYPPGTGGAGIGVFATNGDGWDTTGGLEPGGYGWITLVHEFGHGLGLAHPHDDGGNSTVMAGVTSPFGDYGDYGLNQGVYTTMSYNDGWQLHPNGSGSGSLNYGYQAGPMALDIAVIQEKYGARSNNIGNNTYVLPTANAAGTFWNTIWDTRGTDTIRHNGTVSATIDLTPATLDYSTTGGGMISYVSGIFGGFTIAARVIIENATGGTGNDILIGNSARNVLNGRGGADTMEGRYGSDTYVVNHSGDTVIEAAGQGADLVKASISYTLTANVEKLTLVGTRGISGTGNELNNVITGNAAANTLSGGAGNDTLNGGGGGDTLRGGTGNDTYVVDSAADVVTEAAREGLDLVQSSIDFTLGDNVERLTLTGTEAITGTGNGVANVINGNTVANELYGLGGRDRINGGGGADDLYGGAASDRLTGGEGADDFYFDTALGSTNVDSILDFAAAEDSIYLDQSVFSAIAASGALAAGAFRLGTAAADANDRIIYDSATGNIYYDADGSGSGTAVLFAQVTAGTALSSSDFFTY